MHWQDYVLAISVLGLNAALVPSLWGKAKPRLITSVFTAIVLIPEVIVFFSLSLWFSFVMTLVNICLWTTLAVQRFGQTKTAPSKKR